MCAYIIYKIQYISKISPSVLVVPLLTNAVSGELSSCPLLFPNLPNS